MPIIAKDEGKRFHLPPAGMVQAICFDVWDLGMQETIYQGEVGVPKNKIMIGWEINETIQSEDELNGKRYRLYKQYTLSLNEKATLAKDLSSWRGRPFTKEEKKSFDIEKLIGANCFLNIVHAEVGDKTYANISTVNPLPKGVPVLTPENHRSVPDWIIKKQAKAVSCVPDGGVVSDEEETPF